MEKDITDRYLKLKEKYNLPEYIEIDRDFEIYSISKEEDLIREILKKISSTIDYYTSLLEDIIQPDSRFYTLKEANILNKEQRKKVTMIYNKLLYMNRAIIELNLTYLEDEASKLISKIYHDWQQIKKDLKEIIKTLKESWLKNTEIKSDEGYFG